MDLNTLHARRSRASQHLLLACLGLAVLVAAGCGDDPERLPVYDETLRQEGPVELDQHVALLNRTLEEVVLIAADGDQLDIVHSPVGREPVGLTVTPDRQHLAVLSQKDKTLSMVEVATGATETFAMSAKFDRVSFSTDARFAIVYFSPSYRPSEGELYNPNEFAVIDLQAVPGAADTVTSRALRNFGTTLSAVYFVPPFQLSDGGEMERYAMFLFDSQVTFADLTHPSYEKTVFLRLSPAQASIAPREVMFTDSDQAPELQDFFVYMLADGSDDVYAINLLPGEMVDGRVRVQPSINQLSSGRHPSDMATFVGPDGREKLLTVNSGSADIAIIDAATNAITRVPLEHPANRLHMYEALNPDSGVVEPHAMLYGDGITTTLVSFTRLMEVEDRLAQAVEPLSVGLPVGVLASSPIDGQVIIVHQGGAGLSLVDLHNRFATSLQTQLTVNDFVIDQNGRRLFASLSGSRNLNVVDLALGQATSMPLDFPIRELLWLPKANSLLAFHDSDTGLLTALRVEAVDSGVAAAPPSRDHAQIYAGYLLDGLLEGER